MEPRTAHADPPPLEVSILSGLPRQVPRFRVEVASPQDEAAYLTLRRDVFVGEQGLFTGDDRDETDDDPRRRVLVARTPEGRVVGGVRLAPATAGPDIGWWRGSRLVVATGARSLGGVGSALVRAACAHAEEVGALRFEASVQAVNAVLFQRLGWERVRELDLHGTPHVLVRYPVERVQRLVDATKAPLAALLADLGGGADTGAGALGGAGFRGDDGAPVPGTDLVAACDAIVPSMLERDPVWAGWCAVLVNLNDLAAMGATPVGMLDALAARDAHQAQRIVSGLRAAATAWGVPVLGGHTQLGVPAALSVTALGRTGSPVPAGGGRAGDEVRLTADLCGGWRPGYRGAQWDSTSTRRGEDLRAMGSFVARSRPDAAKDVSMAGLVGTLGMLAEASGTGAEIDVAAVPRPGAASVGDWFTCFPGFAMVTASRPGWEPQHAGPATSAACGRLVAGAGVGLRWPDGEVTRAVRDTVTGWGPA
ncbi:putative N-acetyltransferase (TIGR04045 family) [Kineococcus radiotolerans]|uniref:Putative N-acetyltransferase (TIGR04045 family) n=1 Tax=Kineococcus radiotolerans TaxID=131568 RepID=A0A7W4TJ03_KINRA|nr:MSMEG_0567/sll0787 family protein [Kineococcus radiotolerans]MBB2899337.1 putative N-acetyltransferase (TIGR04045 family) [Kineococcus radiotolerans]